MAGEQDTQEVAAIKTQIESWLKTNNNTLKLDLTNNTLDFKKICDTLFTSDQATIRITLGFKDDNLTKNSSLDQFRSSFNFVALDRLPIPGLDGVPSQWNIYPQTPMSSFSEGVTLEHYDPNTQTLQIHIQTKFFAIYGSVPQEHPMMDAAAPNGTYLQVRRDIKGDIKLNAKLNFN
ncbi:unnamed protein product [Adineta steineri]|uniref:Uncharacterized protein n=1 Tax=Adineta steineri TaxID=433720 RepID=A0A820ADN6_9BILA|nr:unnamed protein product [Adineta steineri]CAF4187080.1 unnamed protein product [Adineta steineri]